MNLPREDLNLLGGSGNAGDLGLVTRIRDQLDCEVEHQTVGIVLRESETKYNFYKQLEMHALISWLKRKGSF